MRLRNDRETARLILRPWDEGFLSSFVALCSDPVAMRFITGGRPIPAEDVRGISDRSIRMWDDHGYGPWAAIDKATGLWVGRIGLNLLHWWPDADKWEVGFELLPRYWGRGLATEGARETVAVAFDEAGLERVISVTHPDHHASRRVMEKCGLLLQGERSVHGGLSRVVWYALDRFDYRRSPAPLPH
jgi:RimJ/RimL family protein N-acetyltransferase